MRLEVRTQTNDSMLWPIGRLVDGLSVRPRRVALAMELPQKSSRISSSCRRKLVAMGTLTPAHQPRAKTSRIGVRRERVTIDFRKHGPVLTTIAHSRHMSTAALARTVIGEWLKTQSVDAVPVGAAGVAPTASGPLQKDAPCAKLTLRMPPDRATKLARQAREAELSQGMYVAQLVDAKSDEPTAAPRQTVAALVRSNAELAALYGDLQALARTLKQVSSLKPADLDVFVAGLSKAVGQHLAFTAPQIAALPTSWRRPAREPD